MILWIFKWILISFVLIFLIHHTYIFFKNVLTIPKTKDLVNKPIKEYEAIMQTISNGKQNTSIMQNELNNFLNNLKNDTINNNNMFDCKPAMHNVFSSYDNNNLNSKDTMIDNGINNSSTNNPFSSY